MVGQTVSHYKILDRIGGGGMGVVYKARDTRLDRLVALKFLPPAAGAEDEEKQRFIHEAKAASALDHANICTIYEIDATPDGQTFIVMAYYEGETLRKKIERGPLKTDELIGIAIQVAQGLSKAHDHSIVHRDIKPANIMLTKEGMVKIVDFGLAKLRGQTVLTKAGTTLGTTQYMSPEQARGEPADHRSDIWALGVVMYEMVTGLPPFRGEYENAVVYGILNSNPEPLTALRTGLPMELERIVTKAMAKDPEDRYQHVDELAVDLRRLMKETTGASVVAGHGPTEQVYPTATGGAPARTRQAMLSKRNVLFTGTIIAIAIAVFILFRLPTRGLQINPDSVTRSLSVPFNLTSYPTLSADGKWVAFGAADAHGKWDVYFMNTAGGEPRRVTSDSSAYIGSVDISDDGSMLAYDRQKAAFSLFDILVVPSLGGVGRLAVASALSPLWIPQQRRLSYMPLSPGTFPQTLSGKFELWTVGTEGSDPKTEYIDTAGVNWGSYSSSWAPTGKAFAFIRTFRNGAKEIVTHNCENGEERQLTFEGKLIDEVFWTNDNHIMYSSTKSGNTDLWIIPAQGGQALQLTRSIGSELRGRLSNDGKRLLYFQLNFVGKIMVGDLETGKVAQLTTDDRYREAICMSPDGRYIGFTGAASTDRFAPINDIYILDRAGQQQRHLLSGAGLISSLEWSPDGRRIAYQTSRNEPGAVAEVYVVPVFEAGLPVFIGRGTMPVWLDSVSLSWASEGKTWVSSVTIPHPVQFYRDSTRAFPVLGGQNICFVKSGGEIWLDMTPNENDSEKKVRRFIGRSLLDGGRIWQAGKELYSVKRSEKVTTYTLPDGKEVEIRFNFPGLVRAFSFGNHGKEIAYIHVVSDSKLVVVENPFK